MQIVRLRIANFLQFKYLDLNLTYPEGHEKAGQPLEKVCLIGRNGTGKTTLLKIIGSLISGEENVKINVSTDFDIVDAKFILDVLHDHEHLQLVYDLSRLYKLDRVYDDDILSREILEREHGVLSEFLDGQKAISRQRGFFDLLNVHDMARLGYYLINIPAEYAQNLALNVDLNQLADRNGASALFHSGIPVYNEISNEYLQEFWSLVTYQYLKRETLRREFEVREDNIEKTKKVLIEEFDKKYPDTIFSELKKYWSKILSVAGLYMDEKVFGTPEQLNESLSVQIKKKNGQPIPFFMLSLGIRNFLFKIGYLIALYFNRVPKASIVLFDEPENSLFPDFLRELVDMYSGNVDGEGIFPNTQYFYATHSPIIASQFDPAERVILDFDEDYNVTYSRGIAPEGDDPNDILLQDFGIANTMTPKGVEMWSKYLDYRQKAKYEDDPELKESYLSQAMDIAMEYKFGRDEKNS